MIRNPEAQSLILKAIGEQPGITRPELEAPTGLSKEMVRNEVKRLSRSVKIHSEFYEGSHHWHLKGELTIIQQVEQAVMDADRAVTGAEIAARLNLESQKVYNPLNKLLEDNKIYLGPSVGERDKAVMTYLHPDNRPAITSLQAKAIRLGMSFEEYERFEELGLTDVLGEAEIRKYCQVFYQGGKVTPQFLGG